MKKTMVVAIAFLAATCPRAATQNGSTDFNKNTNFSQYKTYEWVPLKSPQQLDDLTAEQLVGTLEVELAKKGLTKSKSDRADLLIAYQISSAKDGHVSPYPVASSYDSTTRAASASEAAATTVVHTGQVTLLMFDGGDKHLVWRSTVPNVADANAKPDKKQKHMDSAVEKLLKDYPPKKT